MAEQVQKHTLLLPLCPPLVAECPYIISNTRSIYRLCYTSMQVPIHPEEEDVLSIGGEDSFGVAHFHYHHNNNIGGHV